MTGAEVAQPRTMSLDDAVALLAGDVGRGDTWCGVCGVTMHMWWGPEQVERHRRYHRAEAAVAAHALARAAPDR